MACDAKGLVYETVAELLLFRELADADILEFCWCRDFGGGFIVMGVLVDEDDMSSPLGDIGGMSGSSSRIALRLRVAAPRPVSMFAPCSCSTSSSHLTLSDDDGRSAGSARFRQSLVRSLSDTQILWKRNRSPSPASM